MKTSRLLVTKTAVRVSQAIVTAGHPLGAAVGAQILRRGGNAVVIQVTDDAGLVAGVDHLRPATAAGF